MIGRVSKKVLHRIPISQAAYQEGRSTTEHVFAVKILAEMATTTANHTFHLLMLDMSKAFDTVNRKTLFHILEEILDEDELHILKLLTEDVKLQVKIEDELGEPIITDTGVPQGDCMSALLFILYLAQALKQHRENTDQEHSYSKPRQNITCIPITSMEHDHSYSFPITKKPTPSELTLEGQYADDMFMITSDQVEKERQKRQLPPQLKIYNLGVNESKTEDYDISTTSPEEWKKCRLLGSLLDTEADINKRKSLAIAAYKKKEKIFKSTKISLRTKIRVFNAYITPIFLYNSELWTLTKSKEKKIDAFQRSLLRKIMNIKWPKKITNKTLMNATKEQTWTDTITSRRLSWFGHVCRLNEDAPAQIALKYIRINQNMKKPKGGQKTTWIKQLENDMKRMNMNLNEAEEISKDRLNWRQKCKQLLR
jgi:hypothetical protein